MHSEHKSTIASEPRERCTAAELLVLNESREDRAAAREQCVEHQSAVRVLLLRLRCTRRRGRGRSRSGGRGVEDWAVEAFRELSERELEQHLEAQARELLAVAIRAHRRRSAFTRLGCLRRDHRRGARWSAGCSVRQSGQQLNQTLQELRRWARIRRAALMQLPDQSKHLNNNKKFILSRRLEESLNNKFKNTAYITVYQFDLIKLLIWKRRFCISEFRHYNLQVYSLSNWKW